MQSWPIANQKKPRQGYASRRTAWSADGTLFAVPMHGLQSASVALLDFTPGSGSSSAVSGEHVSSDLAGHQDYKTPLQS